MKKTGLFVLGLLIAGVAYADDLKVERSLTNLPELTVNGGNGLTVYGQDNATLPAVRVLSNTSVDRVWIQGNGNVGIGTTRTIIRISEMDKYLNQLIKLGERIAERAKKIKLPFFEGVPLYDVTLFFWHSIAKGAITTRASAIAFSFFIAFFPFVIFLFTLIPYIPIDNFQNELLTLIQNVVPPTTYKTIEKTVIDIITQPRGDLLSFGFFAALIFSTNGLASMMSALFDRTIHTIHRRSWISQRITAIFLLIILSLTKLGRSGTIQRPEQVTFTDGSR